MSIIVQAISFKVDGVVGIEYIDTDKDVSQRGLERNHTMWVPERYCDDTEEIRDMAIDIIRWCENDLAVNVGFDMPEVEEEDDDYADEDYERIE